jgi:hypothetical protein
MKTYEVELKRTSYVTITVDANNADEAEELAWQRLESDNINIYDAHWELNYSKEIATDETRANGPHQGETA